MSIYRINNKQSLICFTLQVGRFESWLWGFVTA